MWCLQYLYMVAHNNFVALIFYTYYTKFFQKCQCLTNKLNERGIKMIDLHAHTKGSDGDKTPEELIDLAIRKRKRYNINTRSRVWNKNRQRRNAHIRTIYRL